MEPSGSTSPSSGPKYPKVTKKTVITRKVVTSPPRSSGDSTFYLYEEDWWERPPERGNTEADTWGIPPSITVMAQKTTEPKTDYTYSRSRSYSTLHLDEGYISPNMSRRRLRDDLASFSASPATSSTVRHSTMHASPPPAIHINESYLTRHEEEHEGPNPSTRGQANFAEFSDHESDEPSSRLRGVHGLRLPVSSTRSGRKYGRKWAPGSKEEARARRRSARGAKMTDDDTDTTSEYSVSLNDVASYRKFEKQLEYAGSETLLKETPLNHLYGLDQSEAEYSDTEVTEEVSERRPTRTDGDAPHRDVPQRPTSISILVYNFMSTVFTVIRTACSFVKDVSEIIMTSSVSAGTYAKQGCLGLLSGGARIVVYPFSLLYSFIVALLAHIWRAFRWVCYDVWVGAPAAGASPSGVVAYGSAATSDQHSTESTTRTTTTTTTVTETITEEEEEEEMEGDSDNEEGVERAAGRARRRRREGRAPLASLAHASNSDSAFLRLLKTSTAAVTFTMLLPVTAAKGAVRGVKSTASWVVGWDSDQTDGSQSVSAPVESLQHETASGWQHGESSSGVKRRRSRRGESVRDSEQVTEEISQQVREEVTVAVKKQSLLSRYAETSLAVITAILWLPVTLCMGLALAVSRSVIGVRHRVGGMLDGSREQSRGYDEDRDTDTTVVFKADSSRAHTYTPSGEKRSFLGVAMEAVCYALWWPIGVLLALLRWLWAALCGLSRWFVGSAILRSVDKLKSSLVVMDTLLISRTNRWRRAYGCCCCLLPILLIPLLLTCAYYLYDRGLHNSPVVPVLIPEPAVVPPKDPSLNIMGAGYTDEELATRVHAILVTLMRDRDAETRQAIGQDWQAWGNQLAADQQAAMSAHRREVEARIDALVSDRVATLAAGVGSQLKDDVTRQVAALSEQRDKMAGLDMQLAAILKESGGLREALAQARLDMNSQDADVRAAGAVAVAGLETRLDVLTSDLRHLQASQGALTAAFKDCCKNDSTLALLIRKGLEEHLAAMLGGGGSGGGVRMGSPGSSSPTFLSWLHSQFVGRDDMDSRLSALLAKIEDDIKATSSEAHDAATKAAAAVAAAAAAGKEKSAEPGRQSTVVTGAATGGVTEKHVQMLIQQALMLYSADKTGQVDYALESAGGSVVSTRCSETYHRRTAQLSLFGIPLWYTSNSPRTVIQPDMQPGQCWAFRGSTGFLVIQLAGQIRPTAFTLEHIPKTLSPTGKIDSAPSEFSVLGLQSDRDMDGVFLGNFTYLEAGPPLQTFLVTEPVVQMFPIVELRILSNHGNKEYTCLYRFRVHGILSP